MSTTVFCTKCEERYTGMNIHEAAKVLADGRLLDLCPKCHGPRSIRIEHKYPYPPEKSSEPHKFDVTKVNRLFTDEEAEKQEPPFDSMMFFMHEVGTENDYIWPVYWTKNRRGDWWWGQFPPVLTIDQLRLLMNERKDSANRTLGIRQTSIL